MRPLEMSEAAARTDVVSRSPLADPARAAEAIVNRAMASCVQEMRLESIAALVRRLRRGNLIALHHYRYGLARQVAEHLGACDDDVKAVYVYEHDLASEELEEDAGPAVLIHMIVWAHPKTAALNALVAGLNRALTQSYAGRMGAPPMPRLLDVQVVDDPEVQSRAGYAALLFSVRYRPLEVWKRPIGL